eukprot:TRINITY_DN6223_c0_g6_i1.p1 TRINITY_DN6223_c0_g6~~TRINITY_DN6223_c0_g6_i1.p1  ORF type:complete len:333 (-),score=53.00 TRINITY_DN6223_c0_g6_i1:106-1065(-)
MCIRDSSRRSMQEQPHPQPTKAKQDRFPFLVNMITDILKSQSIFRDDDLSDISIPNSPTGFSDDEEYTKTPSIKCKVNSDLKSANYALQLHSNPSLFKDSIQKKVPENEKDYLLPFSKQIQKDGFRYCKSNTKLKDSPQLSSINLHFESSSKKEPQEILDNFNSLIKKKKNDKKSNMNNNWRNIFKGALTVLSDPNFEDEVNEINKAHGLKKSTWRKLVKSMKDEYITIQQFYKMIDGHGFPKTCQDYFESPTDELNYSKGIKDLFAFYLGRAIYLMIQYSRAKDKEGILSMVPHLLVCLNDRSERIGIFRLRSRKDQT